MGDFRDDFSCQLYPELLFRDEEVAAEILLVLALPSCLLGEEVSAVLSSHSLSGQNRVTFGEEFIFFSSLVPSLAAILKLLIFAYLR